MKMPSLVRLPKYRKFSYEPRYYDEVKEEIDQRVAQIERDFRIEQKNPEAAASFKRDWESNLNERQASDRQSNIITVVIMLLLIAGIAGYLFLGNIALYTVVGIVGVYLVYRRLPKRQHR